MKIEFNLINDNSTLFSMTDIGLNYTQPSDASYPDSSYYFEIIKEGIDLGTALITDSFITFGRVPDNTIELEHPVIFPYYIITSFSQEYFSISLYFTVSYW